ncbi:SMI1/KNR4 family protein [Streptomyces sp. NPDC017979]|uniref:SMI1/KNR4 family protein n=1 Tax=Streptomyces sp. NPDC017979 TaxID=3365024 RepID=UPI0037959D75
MTHPSVTRLTHLVPPPEDRPAAPDWQQVETTLEATLPDDYKQLVEAYGGGVFDETIWLLEPGCVDTDYDLVAQTSQRAAELAELWGSGEPKPTEVESTDTARLIPWAYLESSGAYLYWLARPDQAPAEWSVMLNEGRGPAWERHPQGCADFIVGILTGKIRNSYFDNVPPPSHAFDPNSEIL